MKSLWIKMLIGLAVMVVGVVLLVWFNVNDDLYVHVADSGQIMVLPGRTMETRWIDESELREELQRVKEAEATVLFSVENPESEPTDRAIEIFELIASNGVPILEVEEPHPDTFDEPVQVIMQDTIILE